MDAFILPISFKPESIESPPPKEKIEGAGNFEEILQNRRLGHQDRAGEAAKGSAGKRDWKPAGKDGSRKIRRTERKSGETSDPIPVPQLKAEGESSPDILEMAKLLSGASEGSLMKGKEEEATLPQELDSLHLRNLPPDSDPGESLFSQLTETGKGLTNRSPVSIPEPWISSQPAGGQSKPPLSPAPTKDEKYSEFHQDPGKATSTRSEELPGWIETMKSSGPGNLNRIDNVRSQAAQGATQIGKDLQARGEGKTFFTSDSPTAKTAGLAESVADLTLNRENLPFTAQNQEEAPLFERVSGKGPNHPANSLNPAEQVFSGKDQKPADSLPEIRFPSDQQEWTHREGAFFHSESMEGAKPELGNPKIFLGAIEGSATNLNGHGNRIEGAQGSPPPLARAEILNLPEQVVQRIIWSIRNQEERIKLTLDPPDLGHLYIEINRNRENIHATLWADSIAAKTALETGQHQIQRIMENEGFKLAKFDVFLQQDPGWFQGQGKRENHFVPDPRTPIFPFEQNGEVSENSPLDPMEIRRKTWGQNSLDLLV